MPDYGHELLFGTFVTPRADSAERVVGLAQLTDQLGLDLVSVQDHPYQAKFLDTWTLLSVIAASTQTVRLTPNVANLPLRPPATLARSVATLDILSGGRVELGLGAGGYWDAIAAMGGRRLSPGESVEALGEAITILRALWAGDGPAVKVDGRYYRVWGAHPGPAPAHDVSIWLGAYKPRILRLTGRVADGWLPSSPYAPPEELAKLNEIIDEAAASAGRSPGDVRRLYNISGTFRAHGNGFLHGPAAMWAEQLAELTLSEGMSGYIVMGDDPDVIRQFAAEVAPAVREMVADERTSEAKPAEGAPFVPPAVAEARPTAAGLAAPTADDGRRLSGERLWDEAERPVGPKPDPTRSYTARERAAGAHLVQIHDHLRQELAQIRDLVAQVTDGTLDAGAARSAISAMTIRQNAWTVGSYCTSYCRLLTMHHTLEDRDLFPQLRRMDLGLAPVVDRLAYEHEVIHGVLERVDRALVSFVDDPSDGADLRAAVDLLSDTLLSHLSYEERELIEPLSRLGVV